MVDSTEYILPKEALNQAYLRHLPILVIGLAICLLFGISTIASMFRTACILAVLVIGSYLYTKQYKWVYISSAGIQGLSPTGGNVRLEWDEPVTIKSISAFAGIKGFAIKSAKNRSALFIPASIATAVEFQFNLNQVAPKNHPLCKIGNNAP